MSIAAIARVSGISKSVVQRLVKRWRSRAGVTEKSCACGRPAFHPGGCIVNSPSSIGKILATRIEKGVLAGRALREIGDELDLSPAVVAKHSLPARARLYALGKTCACGRILGHPYWCSAKWDEFDQPRGARPLPPHTERQGIQALVRGDLTADIAKQLGVGSARIWKLRRSLRADDLAQRTQALRLRVSQRGKAAGDQIMAAIQSAVSRRIDSTVRDDVVGELYLAVMEGRIEADEIGAAVRSFVSRGLSQWQSAYGPKSLDAPFGADGNGTLGDYLEDGTAVEHIDELHLGAGD